MTYSPFTLDEANEIAEDFEDLIDTDFRGAEGVVYIVDNVVVCPFSDPDKQAFASHYHNTKDKKEALGFYFGGEYDVVVFAYNADDEESYTCFDIRSFTEQRGIKYSFPV